ncbi:MAG: undecaprenyl-diphosphate phosphatase [Acidobacteriota bacterium]|nr:MAG: undecaprenyl-diphosphate phosphatase [Acidobacteriota bacterium]
MLFWQVILLAVLQGLTEFLPISSSGHLAIAEYFMNFRSPGLAFEVIVHAGTLIAVFSYFRKDIACLLGLGSDSAFAGQERKTLLLILLGSVPTGAIGLALQDVATWAFDSMAAVGGGLLATAAFLYPASRIRSPGPAKGGVGAMRWRHAVLVGAAQGLAVMPGVSRTGVTISAGLFAGLHRQFAFSFSFLLSIPAVLGATFLEARHLIEAPPQVLDIALYVAAFLVSAAVGYGALHALRRILETARFSFFAYYCVLVGAAAAVASLV